MALKLKDILPLDVVRLSAVGDIEIDQLEYDSRQVRPGTLFFAVRGTRTDGHRFIKDAATRGAVAVVAEEPVIGGDLAIPVVIVPDTRVSLAASAAAFYGFPSKKLRVVGVTGTDGKTTTSLLISQVLEADGRRTGVISTVLFRAGGAQRPNESRQTTPEALEIQQMLAEMVGFGDSYAVVESTSHGLALHRLDECEYDVAVLTNLDHEHLDFHGTIEGYRAAKAKLFEALDTSASKNTDKVAVLNGDDSSCEYFRAKTRARVVTFGVESQADVLAANVVARSDGVSFVITTSCATAEVDLPLVGEFNVYNALAAAAVGLTQGIEIRVIADALEHARGAPGRMELIREGQPFTVVVDYAHTPQALRQVLGVLRETKAGRLIAVFGSAGERDRAKRSMQGRVAAEMADFCVFTNEDPRFEDEDRILDEIAQGAETLGRIEGRDYLKIRDRRRAIREAFIRAKPGDVVLLAGKGHEQCIIVRDQRVPWDERVVARELLLACMPF
jgi:UDP-N-acetylmuramoyl-L-alanyl-D-glutamate--2,6-diaminopimelate ligase